jgi:hypothetical protein
MILPPSLGLFCQRLGAHPYAAERIETFSRTRDNSEAFGLGAVVIVETDQVRVTIGPRPELDISNIESGVVGLYRVLDTREDYLLREIEFDSSMQRSDGSWILVFSRQEITDDLWVACDLVLPTRTVSAIAPVIRDGTGRHPKKLPTQLAQPRALSEDDPLKTAPPKRIVVSEKDLRTVLHLDFGERKPIIVGNATLLYAGGGNRYLPSNVGPVLQPVNKAPWLLDASMIVEGAGSNEFTKSGLFTKCWDWTATNTPNVLEISYDLPDFSEKLIGFTIQDAKSINTVWQLNFEAVSWTGETITASGFTELKMPEGNTSKFWFGIELLELDGTTVRESNWTELGHDTGLRISSATWAKPSTQAAVPGLMRVALKVTNVDPGDYCQIITGFPQLEYASCAGSRTNGVRQADMLSIQTTNAFDNTFGRFSLEFAPLYGGVPGSAGHQLLIDTRDASGRNGFWIGHRANGLFEFGTSDAFGQVFVRSASVIHLVDGERYRINAYWDNEAKNLRLDLNGDLLVERDLNTLLMPETLTRIRFGNRYNGEHAGNFQIFTFKHEFIS